MAAKSSEPTRNILVISHVARPEAIAATIQVCQMLGEHGVRVVMAESDLADYQPHLAGISACTLNSDVTVADIELAIVLGGDGTILRATELLRGTDCAILGVNLGHVGFLAESEMHDLTNTIERVLARDYTVEERLTIDVKVVNGRQVLHETFALNEASIEKPERERMLELMLGVDDKPISSYVGDGVVLATPTGSTAYAFSAGGPIVWPGVEALVMVPISAHALFNRPLVVHPDSLLEVEVLENNHNAAVLWCDGRRHFDVPPGSQVFVRRSQTPVRLARLESAAFSQRLVDKFHLPVEGWRSLGGGTP